MVNELERRVPADSLSVIERSFSPYPLFVRTAR